MLNPDQKMIRVPLAVEIVTGTRPCVRKCWRWYTLGIGGVKLQTWLVGGSRLTTVEAVREFIERRTNPTNEPHVRKPRVRKLSKQTREILKRELGIDPKDGE